MTMKYWLTSDSHFGHDKIRGYCNRPFKTVEEMDETIISNWNKLVAYNDTVFHLGDFAFRNPELYKGRLNGTIIHIKGNHDDVSESIIRTMSIKFGGITFGMIHDPYGWGRIADNIGASLLLASHTKSLAKMLTSIFVQPTKLNNYPVVLCGHVHDLWKYMKPRGNRTLYINVGVDVWDYKPVSLNEILDKVLRGIAPEDLN